MADDVRLEEDEDFLERVELSELYDYYGGLLSERNRELFESYVLNDLSLAEVAENTGLSRQGVRDAVNRCKHSLKKYEAELHMAEKSKQLQKLSQELRDCADRHDIGGIGELAEKLSGLL